MILCNVCLTDSTSLTKMGQNSGNVARNIASGNKIKNVVNFVTFFISGFGPTLYFLITIRAVQKQKRKRRYYNLKNNISRELAGFFRCSSFVLPQSVQRPKRQKGIYCHQNQTFKSISVSRCSGVLMSFVQYWKIEEENRFSPAPAILENEKNLGTWLQET